MIPRWLKPEARSLFWPAWLALAGFVTALLWAII
jgi:hypothetical protein